MKYFYCFLFVFIVLAAEPAIAQTNRPNDQVQKTQPSPRTTNKIAEKGLKGEKKKEKKAEKTEKRGKRRAHKISQKPASKKIIKKRKNRPRSGERID